MEDWVYDSVMGFLHSPLWRAPINNFVDYNCVVFDTDEENKFAYSEIHEKFRSLVESLLEKHLGELGISIDQFVQSCEKGTSSKDVRDMVQYLLVMDDYLSFKKMMVRRNVELEAEALKALQLQRQYQQAHQQQQQQQPYVQYQPQQQYPGGQVMIPQQPLHPQLVGQAAQHALQQHAQAQFQHNPSSAIHSQQHYHTMQQQYAQQYNQMMQGAPPLQSGVPMGYQYVPQHQQQQAGQYPVGQPILHQPLMPSAPLQSAGVTPRIDQQQQSGTITTTGDSIAPISLSVNSDEAALMAQAALSVSALVLSSEQQQQQHGGLAPSPIDSSTSPQRARTPMQSPVPAAQVTENTTLMVGSQPQPIVSTVPQQAISVSSDRHEAPVFEPIKSLPTDNQPTSTTTATTTTTTISAPSVALSATAGETVSEMNKKEEKEQETTTSGSAVSSLSSTMSRPAAFGARPVLGSLAATTPALHSTIMSGSSSLSDLPPISMHKTQPVSGGLSPSKEVDVTTKPNTVESQAMPDEAEMQRRKEYLQQQRKRILEAKQSERESQLKHYEETKPAPVPKPVVSESKEAVEPAKPADAAQKRVLQSLVQKMRSDLLHQDEQ